MSVSGSAYRTTRSPKLISFWCPKGGVGKSSTTREMAQALSQIYDKNVLVVEFDDQMDVTKFFFRDEELRKKYGIKMIGENVKEEEGDMEENEGGGAPLPFPDFQHFFNNPGKKANNRDKPNNLYDALRCMKTDEGYPEVPDFVTIREPKHTRKGALYMLPGHPMLSELAHKVTIAAKTKDISQSSLTAFNRLIKSITTKLYEDRINLDYVLIDLDPSKSLWNGLLITNSDGFIIPCNSDGASHAAVRDALHWLKEWHNGHDEYRARHQNNENFLKLFKPCSAKFLGAMQRNYSFVTNKLMTDNGEVTPNVRTTSQFAYWQDKIDKFVAEEMVPVLRERAMAFEDEEYEAAYYDTKAYCIGRVPMFHSLGGSSDRCGVPVPFLNEGQLVDKRNKPKGTDERTKARLQRYHLIARDAAARVLTLFNDFDGLTTHPDIPIAVMRPAEDDLKAAPAKKKEGNGQEVATEPKKGRGKRKVKEDEEDEKEGAASCAKKLSI